jgi:hypothetical protein
MKLQCVGMALVAAAAQFVAPSAVIAYSVKDEPLSTWVSECDTVLFAKCMADARAKKPTEFEVLEVLKQPVGATKEWVARSVSSKGDGPSSSLTPQKPTKAGDLFLLLGHSYEDRVGWEHPVEFSQAALEYLKDAPGPNDQPVLVRLAYFLRYLEHQDGVISKDAFKEFENTPVAEVVRLGGEFPRDKVRNWLENPNLERSRLGLYGMMLGLCGNQGDSEFLERKIREPAEEARPGIDGVMSGYLLLTGDRGLQLLEATKIANPNANLTERYAGILAVRFMWQYGGNKIEVERLRQSMRLPVEQPELADLAIADLARMKDWKSLDRLIELYDAEAFDIPSVKRTIVRFTFSAIKDLEAKSGNDAFVAKATQFLADLEQRDPKTFQDASRFFKK